MKYQIEILINGNWQNLSQEGEESLVFDSAIEAGEELAIHFGFMQDAGMEFDADEYRISVVQGGQS